MQPAKADACYKCGSRENLSQCTSCGRTICMRERVGTGSLSDGYQCGLLCSIGMHAPDTAKHGALWTSDAEETTAPLPPRPLSLHAMPPPPPNDEMQVIAPHEPEKTGIHLVQRVKGAGKFVLGVIFGLLTAEALYKLFH